MNLMNRRAALSAAATLAMLPLVAACGSTASTGTSLEMAKVYADDLANAVSAAAAVYLAGPPMPTAANVAMVNQLVDGLQQARAALDSTTTASDARGIALQVLAGVQKLSPLVSAALGQAAAYVPLAVAVIEAFIQSIPPPADAPPTPPVELHNVALKYHGHK